MLKKFTIRPTFIGSDMTLEAWDLEDAVKRFGSTLGLLVVGQKLKEFEVPEGTPKQAYIEFKLGNDRPFYCFETPEE